jgi:hypothetical protein
MKIEILYLDGCPHYLPTVTLLKRVLRQEGLGTEVREIEVKDELAANTLSFFGSPTIRVNGLDIEPDARNLQPSGLACRRYSGGLPSEELIRSAIRDGRAREGNHA